MPQGTNSFDEKINTLVAPVTNFVSDIIFYAVPLGAEVKVPLILLWLLFAGIFFTIYLRFINITQFKHAIKVTKGDFDKIEERGEVSHFQALATALSGTLGLGNIAGVAIAISLGGPGATFWMIVAGLFGMCSKFAECTMGVKYRVIHPDGSVAGGPMYYLNRGFKDRGFPILGKFLAAFFAFMCIGGSIGGGNMFQSNQAARQFINVFFPDSIVLANNLWIIGLILAVAVGVVIIGGIKTIARVTERLVPFMIGLYLLAGLVILLSHFTEIPGAFKTILEGAFSPAALKGGFVGVLLTGLQRAFFSNEAGVGSASIAHSAVKTEEPVSEGMVGLLEPFIDTVIVCTMTALVIIITNTYRVNEADGIALTSQAFKSVISWFPYVLAISVMLFAYSTIISWSYYGTKSWAYLFGHSKFAELSFKFIFCCFTIIGASMDLTNVIQFSDAMIFAMSIPNIIGLYVMAPEIKRELTKYLSKFS